MSIEELYADMGNDQPLPGTVKKAKKKRSPVEDAAEAIPAPIAAFGKCDIRVVHVDNCQLRPFSDKLYVLNVDIGNNEKREFGANMVEHFTPEDVIGRKIVVICNIKPRVIVGGAFTSHAMLFAGAYTDENGKFIYKLCFPPQDAEAGTRIVPQGYEDKLGEPAAEPKKNFEKMGRHLTVHDGKMSLMNMPLVAGKYGPITCTCPEGSIVC